MYPRANIIVFGLWDGFCGACDNHSRRMNKMETMGTQFNRLANFIRQSDVAQDADVVFVDLLVDDPGVSKNVIDDLLDKGYKLPFVMINDRVRFTGSINITSIYNEAKMIVENGCMLC
jgi:disulfide oxidoreductase YuzD